MLGCIVGGGGIFGCGCFGWSTAIASKLSCCWIVLPEVFLWMRNWFGIWFCRCGTWLTILISWFFLWSLSSTSSILLRVFLFRVLKFLSTKSVFNGVLLVVVVIVFVRLRVSVRLVRKVFFFDSVDVLWFSLVYVLEISRCRFEWVLFLDSSL